MPIPWAALAVTAISGVLLYQLCNTKVEKPKKDKRKIRVRGGSLGVDTVGHIQWRDKVNEAMRVKLRQQLEKLPIDKLKILHNIRSGSNPSPANDKTAMIDQVINIDKSDEKTFTNASMVSLDYKKLIKQELYILYSNDDNKVVCLCCGSFSLTFRISKRDRVVGKKHLEAAHVVADSEGGPYMLSNLRPLCNSCNGKMSSRYLPEYLDAHNIDKHESLKGLPACYRVRD